MSFFDFPDQSALDGFHNAAVIVPGMDLCPHLSFQMVAYRQFCEHATFLDRVGQWFFAVTVLFQPHGHRRCRGMRVIGRGDDHRVNVFRFFFEHHTKIAILFRIRIRCGSFGQQVRINVGNRDDVLFFQRGNILARSIGRTNTGEIQSLVRRIRRNDRSRIHKIAGGTSGSYRSDKMPAIEFLILRRTAF